MAVIRANNAQRFDTHGSRFDSYVSPSRGSSELCAWRLSVPAGHPGVPHRPSREEVLLLLTGQLRVTVDGTVEELYPGDVVLVPAGSEFGVDGGSTDSTAWVTTTPGLEAITRDGTRIVPPWAS